MSRLSCFASVIVLVAACSSGTGSPGDAGTDTGSVTCEPPRQACGSRCVNTQSDPSNCGECGMPCAASSVCNDGNCEGSCPSDRVDCSGSCADTMTDPDHCGGCDQPCGADQVCEGGSCQCTDGDQECDGTCVDIDTDTDNCGICGRECDPGQTCDSGSCTGGSDGGMDGGSDDDAGTGEDAGMDAGPPNDAGPPDDAGMGGDAGMACSMDLGEANDSQGSAFALASFSDSPNTMMTFSSFNLHDGMDVDWYRFAVSDDGFDGNPNVEVTLDQIPAGSDFELGVWFECDASGGTTVTCNDGLSDTRGSFEGCISVASGNTDEHIDFDTDCSGTDESGIVIMRVESFTWSGSCDYRLQVNVR